MYLSYSYLVVKVGGRARLRLLFGVADKVGDYDYVSLILYKNILTKSKKYKEKFKNSKRPNNLKKYQKNSKKWFVSSEYEGGGAFGLPFCNPVGRWKS